MPTILHTHLSTLFKELHYKDFVKNQSDFGEKLGYKRAFTSQMLKGTSPIPSEITNKVKSAFGDEWETRLIELANQSTFQSTARIIGDAYRDKFYLGKNSTFRELNDDGEYAIIAPFISVKARAGYLAGWGDQDYLQTLPKTEFSVNEIHKGEYIVIEAEGDSMDNGLKESISDGDKMLCRKLNRELWVNSKLHLHDYNPDFVIHHVTDGLTVKRIIEHNLDDRYIVCSSLNPDKNTYPDFKIKVEEISQIFTVVQTQQNRKRK